MNTPTPFLWFNNNAKEAMDFYVSIFKNSKVVSTMPGPGDSVMGVEFELNGQRFMGLNGGPMYTFTEAISFYVSCENQEEVDYYWDKLTEGGQESQCGWLKDKFGMSWQIIPTALSKYLSDSGREKAGRAMQAMMGMHKIDISKLEAAFNGN